MVRLLLVLLPAILTCQFGAAEDEGRPASFRYAKRDAKVADSNFKLQQIEKYNREARSRGVEPIVYKALSINYPSFGESYETLDFVFPDLSPDQFRVVKSLYGDRTASGPKRGRQEYRLSDFMSPAIQALEGHVFVYGNGSLPEINEDRKGKYGSPDAPVDAWVTTSQNCWSTVIGVLQCSERSFPVFFVGRFQAYDFFEGNALKLGSLEIEKPRDVRNFSPGLRLGDVLSLVTLKQIVKDTDWSVEPPRQIPGDPVQMMDHAVIYIDEGLVFEKPDGGEHSPYSFVALEKSIAGYFGHGHLGTKIEAWRFPSAAGHPRDIFKHDEKYATDERFAQPIPDYLQTLLLMNKETFYPRAGYYNTFAQMVDVPLVWDRETRRYRLSPKAFEASTFDAPRNAACSRLLESKSQKPL